MNGWLADSDLFKMFTQSIKFYAFHYHLLRVQMSEKRSLLKLQTSHRWVETSHRRVLKSDRRVTNKYRRVTDNYRRVTDESQTSIDELQTTTDESQTSHRWVETSHKPLQTSHRRLRRIIPKVFLNTFIKHFFQKGYGFQMPLWKGGFYLNKESLGFDVYQSDGNSPTQEIRQF